MRIQCDVCEVKAASVICCADEAALCVECDVKVHEANKLASKHKRLPLLSTSSKLSSCDICQDKAAFVFCLEDRALLCRDCDENVHVPDTLAANHQRFLATGIKVALGGGDFSGGCVKGGAVEQAASANCTGSSSSSAGELVAKKAQPSAAAAAAYVEPCWTVEELLPLSEFGSKGDEGIMGDFDWNIEDMALFGQEEKECLVEVPQLSTGPHYPNITMNGIHSKLGGGKFNPSSTRGKSKVTQVSPVPDFDEASFVVPDIGMLETGCFPGIPAKRMRRTAFGML